MIDWLTIRLYLEWIPYLNQYTNAKNKLQNILTILIDHNIKITRYNINKSWISIVNKENTKYLFLWQIKLPLWNWSEMINSLLCCQRSGSEAIHEQIKKNCRNYRFSLSFVIVTKLCCQWRRQLTDTNDRLLVSELVTHYVRRSLNNMQ